MSIWHDKATELADLLIEKRARYGNNIEASEAILLALWPQGVPPQAYGDLLLIVRIADKLCRVATRAGKVDADSESPYFDIAGYGLLGERKDELWLASADS